MIIVGNGIYVETGYKGGNVGFIVTDEGVVLVDTPMFPADAQEWRGRIRDLTRQEVIYIVNTDYHLENVLGNCFFSAATIAHESAWAELAARGQAALQQVIEEYKGKNPALALALSDTRIILPEVAITDGLRIYKGDRIIEVHHFGGHTPATLGVYLADSKVLFTGNVVVQGCHPDLSQADSRRWLAALDRIQGMDVEIIVPGRGSLCKLEDLDVIAAYIREMQRRVAELYQGGASRREAVEKVRNAMTSRFPVSKEEAEIVATQIRAGVERIYEETRKGS